MKKQKKDINYCSGCGSILLENKSCSNENCILKKEEIEKQIDKYFDSEFLNIN